MCATMITTEDGLPDICCTQSLLGLDIAKKNAMGIDSENRKTIINAAGNIMECQGFTTFIQKAHY